MSIIFIQAGKGEKNAFKKKECYLYVYFNGAECDPQTD